MTPMSAISVSSQTQPPASWSVWLLWIGILIAAAAPASAQAQSTAARTAQMTSLFAEFEDPKDKWGTKKLVRSLGTRTRIIQMAIVILAITLYIMMRK
jgi:hypothetical protein